MVSDFHNSKPFLWHSFSLNEYLIKIAGDGWAKEIIEFAKSSLKLTPIVPRSVTSREADRDSVIQAAVVDGRKIKEGLPWLHKLYRTDFLQLAGHCSGERVVCATNDLYGANLNVQVGTTMRYECHVDSNPLQGMLYVTSHTPESGGELIVANSEKAETVSEVLRDCARIAPERGNLVFFDARRHSHFVTALTGQNSIRVAVAMNFYTSACPESRRPADLSQHLGLA